MVDVVEKVRERFNNTQKSKQPLKLLSSECKAIAKDLMVKANKHNVNSINGISVSRIKAAHDGKLSFKNFDFGIGIEFEYMG